MSGIDEKLEDLNQDGFKSGRLLGKQEINTIWVCLKMDPQKQGMAYNGNSCQNGWFGGPAPF